MNIFDLNDIEDDDIFCRQITHQDVADLEISIPDYHKYCFIVDSDGCSVPDLIIPTEAGIEEFRDRDNTIIIAITDASKLGIEYEGDLI